MIIKEKVLIVEDEEAIIHVLSTILTTNGYGVIVAKSGEQALMLSSSHCPDIILLDLGLPDMDGVEVLKKIREYCHCPILIVSARDLESEKVQALDIGADDYITKPFGTSELLARIRTALRHSANQYANGNEIENSYAVGDFKIDFKKHCVIVKGKDVHLTQIEFKIVELIARQPGRVLTYDYIMEHIWGPYTTSDNKILRVNMANIRRKIEENPGEPKYIFTEVGIGYRMADNEES